MKSIQALLVLATLITATAGQAATEPTPSQILQPVHKGICPSRLCGM